MTHYLARIGRRFNRLLPRWTTKIQPHARRCSGNLLALQPESIVSKIRRDCGFELAPSPVAVCVGIRWFVLYPPMSHPVGGSSRGYLIGSSSVREPLTRRSIPINYSKTAACHRPTLESETTWNEDNPKTDIEAGRPINRLSDIEDVALARTVFDEAITRNVFSCWTKQLDVQLDPLSTTNTSSTFLELANCIKSHDAVRATSMEALVAEVDPPCYSSGWAADQATSCASRPDGTSTLSAPESRPP